MTVSQPEHQEEKPDSEQTINQEVPRTDFDREDERWQLHNQLRDWMILLVMIAVYMVWTGIVYFFEPGIR
jgi:hypothetical protein